MHTLLTRRMACILITAGIGLTAALAYPHAARVIAERKLARVRKDYREIAKACATLAVDNCGLCFPEDNHLSRELNSGLPLTFETQPSIFPKGGIVQYHRCLTTPIAYMRRLPGDPFNHGRQYAYASFRASSRSMNFMAILSSPGPDGKTDLPLEELRDRIEDYRNAKHAPWRMSPSDRGVIRQWIDPFLYDPTNGTLSRGDLLRVMETHHMCYGFGFPADPKWIDVSPPEMMPDLAPKDAGRKRAPGMDRNEEEADWSAWRVTLPLNFYKALAAAGVLEGDGQTYIGGVVADRVDRLRNHLGAFQEFFTHPTPRTIPEHRQALDAWRREDPRWWEAMRDVSLSMNEESRLRRMKMINQASYDLYPLVILYGKSQLLEAADEAGRDDAASALRRIAALRDGLKGIANSRELMKRDPGIERIHLELGRLCDELEANIAALGKQKETANLK